MTGNSCYEITVAVNTPLVIYLRMLSGLTRILHVNCRNIPTPPVETCHSYYDTELRPDVKEEKGRERKRERERGRDQEEAQRSQKRGDPFCEGNTPYLPFVDWNPISIVTLRPACTVAHWRINHSSQREAASLRGLYRWERKGERTLALLLGRDEGGNSIRWSRLPLDLDYLPMVPLPSSRFAKKDFDRVETPVTKSFFCRGKSLTFCAANLSFGRILCDNIFQRFHLVILYWCTSYNIQWIKMKASSNKLW